MEKQEKTIEIPLSVYQNFLKQAERIAELKQQVEWLTEQFRLARHKQFGASSEQTDDGQLCLFNEAEQTADLTAPEPEITGVKAHYRKKTRLTTDKLPEDLPVEIIRHELPEEKRVCPDCGCPLHKMGEDIREELKIIPAKAVIVRHVRYIYACRHCEERSDHVPIVKAELPNPVIKGGFASPEAVAHIASQKFVMGSPLYRQEQEWAQNGILLSRQTMSNWLVKACEDWLEPIYEEMRRRLCGHQVLHADETTLQVLREDGKSAQSKSYMWLYRTSGDSEDALVLYRYERDRKQIRPQKFLTNFHGYLHCDGYSAYHNLPDDVICVGCWSHLRRKLIDAKKAVGKSKSGNNLVNELLPYIEQLFLYEKVLKDKPPDERQAERLLHEKPIAEQFLRRLEEITVSEKSALGRAVAYAQGQKKYLMNFFLDGRLELTNNRAERSIKPFVIGRKNFLFANTPRGAQGSAIYYSLVETCKDNGIDPYA